MLIIYLDDSVFSISSSEGNNISGSVHENGISFHGLSISTEAFAWINNHAFLFTTLRKMSKMMMIEKKHEKIFSRRKKDFILTAPSLTQMYLSDSRVRFPNLKRSGLSPILVSLKVSLILMGKAALYIQIF